MDYQEELRDALVVGEQLGNTVLAGGRTRDELVACLLAGKALGLPLAEALVLYADERGRVHAPAALMRVLAERAGWQIAVKVVGEQYQERAEITLEKDGVRHGWVVTMDDVARADLLWQSRWKQQRVASLVAYATTQAIRVHIPWVLGPLGYTAEEGFPPGVSNGLHRKDGRNESSRSSSSSYLVSTNEPARNRVGPSALAPPISEAARKEEQIQETTSLNDAAFVPMVDHQERSSEQEISAARGGSHRGSPSDPVSGTSSGDVDGLSPTKGNGLSSSVTVMAENGMSRHDVTPTPDRVVGSGGAATRSSRPNPNRPHPVRRVQQVERRSAAIQVGECEALERDPKTEDGNLTSRECVSGGGDAGGHEEESSGFRPAPRRFMDRLDPSRYRRV